MRKTQSNLAFAGRLRLAALAAAFALTGCVTTTMKVHEAALVSDTEFLALNARISLLPPNTQEDCLNRFDKSGDANDLVWCESYVMNDLVDRYELSGSSEDAATMISHAERVQKAYNRSVTDVLRGRVVGGWITKNYSGGRNHAWAVHTGMLSAPMARFAAVIKRKNQPELRPIAQSLLEFSKTAFLEMEGDWKSGAYRSPAKGLKHPKGDPLPLNQQAAMGLLALNIYQADRSGQRYLVRAKRIAQFIDNAIKSRVTRGKVRLVWPYAGTWGAEDTSHAILTMGFITKMHEAGLVFDEQRYRKILSSFLDGAIGQSSNVSFNIAGKGQGDSFKSTCHRALLIYRYHKPTFFRCQTGS